MNGLKYPLIPWEHDCEHQGSWRGNERYCNRDKKWVKKDTCSSCLRSQA